MTKSGNLRLELVFEVALSITGNVLVYREFDIESLIPCEGVYLYFNDGVQYQSSKSGPHCWWWEDSTQFAQQLESVVTAPPLVGCVVWHLYTDDHRGQLIADVISNSDHITLNTNTQTRMPNTTLPHTSSPNITTVSNTLYNRTSWTTQHALSSDHLPIITTINIRHHYRLQQNPRTNYKKADWTQFTEDTESAFAHTTISINIHTAN